MKLAKRIIAAAEAAIGILAGLVGAVLLGLLIGTLFAILWLPLGAIAALLGAIWGWDFGRWAVED